MQDAVTTHVDLAPTLFHLAGIPARDDFDGTAIPMTPEFEGERHEHVTVEYWGSAVVEGIYSGIGQSNIFMVIVGYVVLIPRQAREDQP